MFNDILNDNDLPILADDLQDDVTLMATIGVLPPKFIVKENQLQFEGDVLAEETEQAALIEDQEEAVEKHQEVEKKKEVEVMKSKKPQQVRQVRSFYIKAHIDGRMISWVLIDSGALMNVMKSWKSWERPQKDLKETKMTNFTKENTKDLGFYVVDLTIGSKTSTTVFSMVDAKLGYSLLLGKDWIHVKQYVASTLH